MRLVGTGATFFSAIFFPWPLTACLALGVAFFEPWVPFAAGLFIDTLYYFPQAGRIPIFTLVGALTTVGIFFVRRRLKTSPVR